MAGQILGDRYEVERQIGKQTGRWTLLARDLKTQERVVIKLLFLDDALEWDDLKLFEREVEILKALSHPSIPRYLGFFEHQLPNDKALALIQTYVPGKSLEQCLQEQRLFTEAETKQLAKALLNILIYLHGQQPPIVHRDIKPSNILLANRQVYLVDFGSVKSLTGTGDTSAFTVVGTYGYMPPEQFSGRAIPASDLYSLGATLTAMLAGAHPSSLPHKGTKLDFEKIANLSPAYADWLGWLTNPNLEQRVRSAQEALAALEQGGRRSPMIAPIAKPTETKISLTQDATHLEIFMPSLLGQAHLHIDQQQISLSQKRLGFQTGRPLTAPRKQISRLEYRKAESAQNNAEPYLALWAGTQEYELKSYPPLTVPEADWLAYELSTWLKLPIQ
ncbi:serine/threonine protein kinase [Leptolyngbya sp. FACHB-321]|uniref:serine/threonine protein kinase n=1 Tax=Leptolyngbya sp. FACHB-321 TaxID=2692807 RepID=UPI00168584E0|nr:serine/threonine-protein kinase [Leptolyngbya sp. FACHB-321]MBD2038557.1 serine/threonine protein kinase [Leptolyngbya sp. FACHB-321]